MKKQIAIYARVSSEQQVSLQTIRSQVAALLEQARADNCSIPTDLQFIDDGYSGTSLRRPALERLRDAACNGAIKKVYIQSPDRLSRKFSNQILLVEEFLREGVEIIFLNRPLGSTPEDQLLLHIQGIVAEYEREKLLERARRGKLHSARSGSVSALGSAPYGYTYLSKKYSRSSQARFDINQQEAEVVVKIFQWFGREKLTISEICRRLHRETIKTRSGKSIWNDTTVAGILKNPAYRGEAAYGKTRYGPKRPPVRMELPPSERRRRDRSVYNVPEEDWIKIPVPSIITSELFECAQEIFIQQRNRIEEHKCGTRFLLQGLVRCKLCGYTFYGKPAWSSGRKRFYAYYRCRGSDRYRFGGKHGCDNRQISQEELEPAVWEEVVRVLKHPDLIELGFEDYWICNQNDVLDMKSHRAQVQLLTCKLQEISGPLLSNLHNLEWQQKRHVLTQILQRIEIEVSRITLTFRIDGAEPKGNVYSRSASATEGYQIVIPRSANSRFKKLQSL